MRRLRVEPGAASIPVAALTADSMPAQIQIGLDAGFNAYLPKPPGTRSQKIA
jgi:CheY-like chemotaxis protein